MNSYFFVVPVTTATLTSSQFVNNKVIINSGDTAVFICITDACRPQARIEWYRDGVNITDNSGVNSNLTDADVTGPKVTTTGTLSITGEAGDGNSTLQCKAVNIEGQTSVESSTLTLVVTCKLDN